MRRTMRVLLISAAYTPAPGGVATHVDNLAHGLIHLEEPCEVDVVTKGKKRRNPAKDKGRLRIWKIREKNVPNFSGRRAPFYDIIEVILKYWRQIIRADVIHCHDLDSTYIGWMVKVAFDKPLIMTMHRAPIEWTKNRHKESAKDCFMRLVRMYQLVDRIVVPSKTSKYVLVQQGFKDEEIQVIPHGINCKHLSSYSDLEFINNLIPDNNTKLILCPARADEHKDPETFIKTAAILKRSYREQRLFFILTGKPTKLYQLYKNACALGLKVGRKKDILFRNFAYNQMPTLYRRASVCVIPSLRESFGLTVVESFVFRTPVVATNTGALNEIVTHGDNGLLFTLGSHKDCAKRVQDILDDANYAKKLCNKALHDVITRYDYRIMAQRYYDFYKRIIEEHLMS